MKMIFPNEPPVPTPEPRKTCAWCLALAGLALLLISVLALVLAIPALRDRAFAALDVGRQSDVDRLDAEVDALLDRYAELLESGDQSAPPVEPDQVGRIERELTALADRLAQHGHAVPERPVPLGFAPCLPVVPTGSVAGGAPGYLFDVSLGADGIRVQAPAGIHAWSSADRDDPDFPVLGALPDGPLTIAQFERLVRPISERARSNACVHYVLLREGEGRDRDRYIQQRSAVDRHFYVYRPHP